MLAGSLTSQARGRTLTPAASNSEAACRQRSFLRAQRTRCAPISASPSAIWRPRPTAPPVMIATRPVRPKILEVVTLGVVALGYFRSFKIACVYIICYKLTLVAMAGPEQDRTRHRIPTKRRPRARFRGLGMTPSHLSFENRETAL